MINGEKMVNEVVREKLRSFLEQNGCQTTFQVMETLEPLFRMVENGRFVSSPSGQIDVNEIATAITTILDLSKPIKIMLISQEEAIKECSELRRKELHHRKFTSKMWDAYRTIVRDTVLGKKIFHGLWDSMEDAIRPSIRDHSWDSAQGNILFNIFGGGGFPWGLIVENCYFFVAFSLVNNQEQAKKFLPLISFINQGVLIFGGTEDEPDIYLVLKW